ncbi:hypothetical protein GF407_05875 [candidate division KSB1 bacterium]|nr:hypothetical protein [candidate division KSB1 bacterium]
MSLLDDYEMKKSGNMRNDPTYQHLSHEIRSVIQGLLGYIAIFGDEVKPQLTVEQTQLYDRIDFFALKLSDYITELLELVNEDTE